MAVAAGQGWGCEGEAPTTTVDDDGDDDKDSSRSKCAEDPRWMRLLFAREAPQSFQGPEGAAASGEEAECAATEAHEGD